MCYENAESIESLSIEDSLPYAKRSLDTKMTLAHMICCYLIVATGAVATLASAQPEAAQVADAQSIADRAGALIDQGQWDEAQALLSHALIKPFDVDALPSLRMLALLQARKLDFVAEAATHNDILRITPTDRDAQRGRAFALAKTGAPQLAFHYAQLHADAFSAEETLELQQAAAGRSVKWGELEAQSGLGPRRFDALDRALEQNSEVLASHVGAKALASPSAQRTEFDRIVALRARVRMREAITLYQDLKQRQTAFPAYALAAAADAYLYERQPEQARDLYLQALTLSKNDRAYPDRGWQLRLFDAYVDANDFAAARTLIEQLEHDVPPIINVGLRGVELDNEFYTQTRVNAARLPLYADQLWRSESMLNELLAMAPFNIDARLAYGDLLLARDRPRAARDQFNAVRMDDPGSVDAAVGVAEAALTLHDAETTGAHLQVLAENYPESRAVQRVQRELDIYRRPVLKVTAETGRSPTGGGSKGNTDNVIDVTLYSAPLHDHWRVFAHSFNATADFDDETATRKRIGVGGEYRAPNWESSAELSQKQFALDESGVSLRGAWMPTDPWRFALEFDSRSNDIPLRASAAGIDAKALGIEVRYSQNESRKFSVNLAQLSFDDDNRRTQAAAAWTERWVSGPVYKLHTRLGLSASRNTLMDADYFNPQSDRSLELSAINEWTPWRRYERSFKHRVALDLGRYWQESFGAKFSSGLRYEHDWTLDSSRTLSYGVAYRRQPFDGVMDKRTVLFLNMTWHF